jgi:hypothetical protein
VADVLSVKLEAMISSAQTLADQADEMSTSAIRPKSRGQFWIPPEWRIRRCG